MARLQVRIDLGAGLSPGQFAAVASDFAAFTDLATRWAEAQASAEAREFVSFQDFREVGRDYPRLSESDRSRLNAWREAVEIWDDFGQMPPDLWFERVWRRYYRPGKLPAAPIAALSAIGPFAGPPSLEAVAPDLFRRLVSGEQRRRMPGPVVLESVVYRNPIEFNLQDAVTVGGLLLGTGAIPRLLEIAKDYTRPGRRERAARATEAEANARIRTAEASEAELRVRLMETLAESELDAPGTEALIEAIGDDAGVLRLLARFGELSPETQELVADDQ